MRTVAVFGMQVAIALIVAGAGSAMILGSDGMVRAFESLGLGATPRMLIGAVETIAGTCLLLPRSAMIGSAVLITLCLSVSGTIIADAAQVQYRTASVPTQIAAPRIEQSIIREVRPRDVLPSSGRDI